MKSLGPGRTTSDNDEMDAAKFCGVCECVCVAELRTVRTAERSRDLEAGDKTYSCVLGCVCASVLSCSLSLAGGWSALCFASLLSAGAACACALRDCGLRRNGAAEVGATAVCETRALIVCRVGPRQRWI
jgi:hypothetical protein